MLDAGNKLSSDSFVTLENPDDFLRQVQYFFHLAFAHLALGKSHPVTYLEEVRQLSQNFFSEVLGTKAVHNFYSYASRWQVESISQILLHSLEYSGAELLRLV